MQRKALKQLNKVTQWTNEKVFAGDRTHFSDEFADFEGEVEPLKTGIVRLSATSKSFYDELTKLKPTADPYPSVTTSKDKLNVSEALGLVMIDYGHDAGGTFGDGLVKYGFARCKLATAQEEFGGRLHGGFMESTEAALAGVNDYKVWRKKMDSRRLTLDSVLSRKKNSKKESEALDQEVEMAQLRFDEAQEETQLRMQHMKQHMADHFEALDDLLDAELEYYTNCKAILEELRATSPFSDNGTNTNAAPIVNIGARPRSKSASSTKAGGNAPTRSNFSRAAPNTQSSSDEEEHRHTASENRSRSDSNTSAGKGRRSMLSSIASFGSKAKSFGGGKSRYGNISDDERQTVSLATDEEDSRYDPPIRTSRPTVGLRARSHSSSTALNLTDIETQRRRPVTSPSSPNISCVKVIFDFEGREPDELPLTCGKIVRVTREVNADWCIGECDGRTGLFPRAYTVEYIPVQMTSPLRTRSPLGGPDFRHVTTSMPPAVSPTYIPPSGYPDSSESELDTFEDDGRDHDSTLLATAAQPPPVVSSANRSRSSSVNKKPAPPPPPSRRNTASNLAGIIHQANNGVPPPPRSRSSTVSRGTPIRTNSDQSGPQSPFSGPMESPFADVDRS